MTLIKTCCGGTSEEVSERLEKKLSHARNPTADVLILKSSSKGVLPGLGNTPRPGDGNVSNRMVADNYPLANQPENYQRSESKIKRKRKKRVKKTLDATIEEQKPTKVEPRQDDSSLEQRKESQIEEKKVQPKPLKGILKNARR